MRRIGLLVAAGLLFCILSGTTVHAATVWKMAFVAPPPVWGPVAEKYGEIVARKTNNEFEVKWFGGGQLGSLPQLLAGVKTGQIDMVLCDLASLAIAKGGKDFNIMFAPYAFRDQEHFRKVLTSRVYKEMTDKVEKEGGFKYLGYVSDRAPRQISTTNRRITKLEDLKGLKIRVPEIKMIMEVMKAWGASPTPLAASELYTSLKQGLVEGQDNGFDSIAQAKYYEVQKYVAVVDYVRSGLIVLMAADNWNKLTPQQKKAFEEAVPETEEWATKWTNTSVAESIDILKKQGMEITYPDLGSFKKVAAEANKRLEGDLWEKGLFEKIQAVK
jgi:tripartite ATP-independent transporter DctP family solute receptor